MSAFVAAVVVGATTVYAANKASSAAKSSAAAQERAAQGLSESADYAADMSYKLGTEQLDFAKRQYEEMKPTAQKIADQQILAQQQQMDQAKDYYDYNVETFRPVEKGLVADAERFSTEGYREQLARDAAAASARAFGQTQDMSARAAAARGINPNSGAGMALQTQGNLGLAAQRAHAMTGARSQAEQMGFARRLDVTGLGRNLPGVSTAAYQGATNAGTAGINTSMAPGNQYTAAVTPAMNTMTTGAGQRAAAYGTLYTGATSSANAAAANEMGVYGAVVGAGGRIAAAGMPR